MKHKTIYNANNFQCIIQIFFCIIINVLCVPFMLWIHMIHYDFVWYILVIIMDAFRKEMWVPFWSPHIHVQLPDYTVMNTHTCLIKWSSTFTKINTNCEDNSISLEYLSNSAVIKWIKCYVRYFPKHLLNDHECLRVSKFW